jgi:hypothetical protein
MQPKPPLTLDDWLTASGRYPSRATSPELTKEILDNAKQLIISVNGLLSALGVATVIVSSGFRPLAANAKAGGAKRSGHLLGKAVDLVDVDGELAKVVAANPKLLKKHGLMIENPRVTVTENGSRWLHIDNISRADRPSRMFTP